MLLLLLLYFPSGSPVWAGLNTHHVKESCFWILALPLSCWVTRDKCFQSHLKNEITLHIPNDRIGKMELDENSTRCIIFTKTVLIPLLLFLWITLWLKFLFVVELTFQSCITDWPLPSLFWSILSQLFCFCLNFISWASWPTFLFNLVSSFVFYKF